MKKLLFACLVFMPLFLYAQKQGQEKVDSLLPEIAKAKDDSNKVKILFEVSYLLHALNPDEGTKYGKQAFALSERLGWKQGLAMSNSCLGNNAESRSEYPQALAYHFEALKLYESLGDQQGIAKNMGSIGLVYYDLHNYAKALAYDSSALSISIKMDDKAGVARNIGNMGSIYTDLPDLKKALACDSQALKIDEELGDIQGQIINVGNMGLIYEAAKDYSKALQFMFRALRIAKQVGEKNNIEINLGNIGAVYLVAAKDTAARIKPDSLISGNKIADLLKANEYLSQGIIAAKAIDDIDAVKEFSQGLSEAQALSGDYKAALESYRQYTTFKDSIFSTQNSTKIANLETQKDIDIKNKEIQLATLKNRIWIGGFVLLLLGIGYVYKNYKGQKILNRLLSKEKKRSDDLLLNILPAEVAEELKDTGRAVAKYFDDVTVLFTDFVNFTNAGERFSPQELVNELDVCFKAFDGILGRYKIEKIKTIGDAYLAVSGMPVANDEHALHIVNAAIEILEYMLQRRAQLGDKTFEIRIGIHTGNVVAGIVGVRKFAYDIWGDTVNTAARMEQHSKPGKINISQSTYEIVKERYSCTYRGEIEAKNKGVLRMYFVEDTKTAIILNSDVVSIGV